MYLNKGSQSGLSLIEVMVSFSILIIIFISLTQAFPLALTINKTSENAAKASYLAQAKLEEINSLNYDSIPMGTIEPKARLSNDSSDYLYYFQRQTLVEYVNGSLESSASETGLKKITVTVYYSNVLSKTEKNYSTVALISRW